jgi:hypothetical protein
VLIKELNDHASGLLKGRTVRSARANEPTQIRKTPNHPRADTIQKRIALEKLAFGGVLAVR